MLTSFSSLGRMLNNKMAVIDETNRTHYFSMDLINIQNIVSGAPGPSPNLLKNVVDDQYTLTIIGGSPLSSIIPNTNMKNGTHSLKLSQNNYGYYNTPSNLYSNNQTIAFKFFTSPTYNTTNNNYVFVSNYNNSASTNGYLHFYLNGSNIEVAYTFTNPSTTTVILSTSIGTYQWCHVAIVRNGTTDIKLYFNGLLVATINNTTDYKLFNNSNDNQFYFGRNPGQAYYYIGFTDDFRIYSRILSLEEIQILNASCLM